MLSFPVLLGIFGGACLLIAVFFAVVTDPRCPLSEKLDLLPRTKLVGAVLTMLVLVACVPHCEELLGPDSVFVRGHFLQVAVVPILFLLICYADFLFARAFAIGCVYSAYVLLREGFAAEWTPLYPLLASLFFLTGSLGIVLGAKPVWMRDWFRASTASVKVRYISASIFALAGLDALIVLVLHFVF